MIHTSEAPELALAERLVAFTRQEAPLRPAAPRLTIAVSGGSTPRALFRLLAAQYRDAAPWERVAVFQVDERCVPPDHAESNWRMLHTELLSRLPRIQAYRIEAEREDAAERYEPLLRSNVPAGADGVPVLDLVLLGMGADGHTASLFPETSALDETERLVIRHFVPTVNAFRVTMTFPLLNRARHRWLLVRGADKAAAFASALRGELPAGRIQGARWFVDPAVRR